VRVRGRGRMGGGGSLSQATPSRFEKVERLTKKTKVVVVVVVGWWWWVWVWWVWVWWVWVCVGGGAHPPAVI
jgi:hypothetical protein